MFIYPAIERDPLLHLCITEPLRRGSAVIVEQNSRGILAYDPAARLHLMGAADPETAQSLLRLVRNPYFIMLLDARHAPFAEDFGFAHRMYCRQAAWLKPEPPPADPRLHIAPPDERALARIIEAYRMDSPEELRSRAAAGELFFASDPAGRDAGFVGLHPEGCFGMLQVFPEQRGRGYGAALEKHIIRFCLSRGDIPYCQVDIRNTVSLNLQRSLGMSLSPQTMLMLWNDFS